VRQTARNKGGRRGNFPSDITGSKAKGDFAQLDRRD
jgi:hypothetical protein